MGQNKFCAKTIQLIQTHSVLKPTRVGNNFLLLAHINVNDVANVKKYNCHIWTPNTSPGTMIRALAVHDRNSTIL